MSSYSARFNNSPVMGNEPECLAPSPQPLPLIPLVVGNAHRSRGGGGVPGVALGGEGDSVKASREVGSQSRSMERNRERKAAIGS